MDNVFVKTLIDWLHIMATITWIGGMFINMVVLRPVMMTTLSPTEAGKFMGALMKRFRAVVYVSIVILGVTGIPLKIINENYISIINFENDWEIISFVKHILYGLLVILAVYNFELLTPRMSKLGAQGPSPALTALQKQQMLVGSLAFLTALVILVLSSLMRYI
jgi:uncharacterized membrane protein